MATRLLTEKAKDRIASGVIRVGGIFVILVVAAIVVNISLEALPLFGSASSGPVEVVVDGAEALAVGSDSRRETRWTVRSDGSISFFSNDGVAPFEDIELTQHQLVAVDHEIHGLISALDTSGQLLVGRVRFRDDWVEGVRTTRASWRAAADPLILDSSVSWAGVTANSDGEGGVTVVAWPSVGPPVLAVWDSDDEEWQRLKSPDLPGSVVRAAVAEDQRTVAFLDGAGGLRIFRLPQLTELVVEGIQAGATAARFLIGGGSLVVTDDRGRVAVLLEVPRVEVVNGGSTSVRVSGQTVEPGRTIEILDDEVGAGLASKADIEVRTVAPRWQVVRDLAPLPAAGTAIAPGHRRRSFLVGAADGTVALYYSTSARRLLQDRWSDGEIAVLALDPKEDGAVVLAEGDVLARSIRNPHPEVSLRTLFLPVWYEGYAAPKWVWQTTGGSDAFEPKMSLWPLIFGTLKATLYAMLFSVPLALMAAIYVSQLAPPRLQSMVKPTVELMAAVPSVVVGFLAALWLAPRLESALLASLIGGASLPFAVVLALGLWRVMPSDLRRRMPPGGELLPLLLTGTVVVAAVVLLADPIESWFFGGDFQRWLFTEWGIRYDQRNSIVVGLALGFAVIPVIFTIAEDACSAVPASLVTASRALGATRWQTAIRLVVPAASPGLFAAVMLGLGRAVGETMIVLMAAGNTPLLDLSLFNGMRTMSAAIAVEIPEAPVGSTLFRMLFLTGTLLFVFTLVVTTVADVVGSYLRRRYARF